MNIVKDKPGIMMLEQYGNKYIRYDAGGISEDILQVKITDEEFERVQKDEITMEGVVNYYDNRGLCLSDKLTDDLVRDHLKAYTTYSEERLDMIIEKLHTHGDVFFEFYFYVLYEEFEEYPITVEGYTAQYLKENYKLTVLGAYNYLIYLRDKPEKALADLKSGFHIK